MTKRSPMETSIRICCITCAQRKAPSEFGSIPGVHTSRAWRPVCTECLARKEWSRLKRAQEQGKLKQHTLKRRLQWLNDIFDSSNQCVDSPIVDSSDQWVDSPGTDSQNDVQPILQSVPQMMPIESGMFWIESRTIRLDDTGGQSSIPEIPIRHRGYWTSYRFTSE